MKQFTPEQKHEILLEYQPRSPTHNFSALAARHLIIGGGKVVKRWHDRWNHTAASLQHKSVPGRPRRLTPAEVKRHIALPIRRRNRAHLPVHYNELQPVIAERTGREISVRTIQRYGKEELQGRHTHGKKRTAEERECMRASVLLDSICCCSSVCSKLCVCRGI
jgi:hypothetical protein